MKQFFTIFLSLFLSFQMISPMKKSIVVYELPFDVQKEILEVCKTKERHLLGQTNKRLYELYQLKMNQCFEGLKKEKWNYI